MFNASFFGPLRRLAAAVGNCLIVSRLRHALQKAVFRLPKGRQSRCKRPSFATPKTVFCKPAGHSPPSASPQCVMEMQNMCPFCAHL